MENLKKALLERESGPLLVKAKYTKRTGTPGNYKYEYGEKKGRMKRKKLDEFSRYDKEESKKETEDEKYIREEREYESKKELRLKGIKQEKEKAREERTKKERAKKEKEDKVKKEKENQEETNELQSEVNQLLKDLKEYEAFKLTIEKSPGKYQQWVIDRNKEDIRFSKREIYAKEAMIAKRKGIKFKHKERPEIFTMYPGEDYRVKELQGE